MTNLSNDFINISVSHATLRNEDLIPAFCEFLQEHNKPAYDRIANDENYKYIIRFGNYDTETAFYLVEDLINALNEIAPNNCYFGAHEGNGSDFGFWELYDIE